MTIARDTDCSIPSLSYTVHRSDSIDMPGSSVSYHVRRLRFTFIALVTGVVFGQGMIAVFPGAASAEWTEASWPCDVGEGASLPAPVHWFEVGQSVMAPAGYFTYGEPPSVALPVSDFTATVDWGDGTTAPAQVEAGSVGDCYVVSAPSHVYTATGAYAFSYTVHDLSTGLDHKLAAIGTAELHVYSKVPQLVGASSSRAIEVVVGTPWTGVVGEFSYAGLFGFTSILTSSSNIYSAEIEWGDGEEPTAGTIKLGSSEPVFTVSGTHTYARSVTGTIKVLLSSRWGANNFEPLGTWTTGDVNATPALAFDGRPFLAVVRRGAKATLYELVFRLSRALAQTTIGHAESAIEANGHTSPVRQLTARQEPACYVASVTRPKKRKLRPGAPYPFTLVVAGASDTRDKTYGLVRSVASISRMHTAARRQLGCA